MRLAVCVHDQHPFYNEFTTNHDTLEKYVSGLYSWLQPFRGHLLNTHVLCAKIRAPCAISKLYAQYLTPNVQVLCSARNTYVLSLRCVQYARACAVPKPGVQYINMYMYIYIYTPFVQFLYCVSTTYTLQLVSVSYYLMSYTHYVLNIPLMFYQVEGDGEK